ncbi:MAG TPA: hypothetical protein PLD73_00525 [Candidatus Hydrogenedentes bacterium]|jgi:hypothetical protein|nr:hypothetical protein [Candidatus Hydrogenedentota bacterium]
MRDWVPIYVLLGLVGSMMTLLVIGEELTTKRKKRFFAFNVGDMIDAVYHRQHRNVYSFFEAISFRTVVVTLTVFGLSGLALTFLITFSRVKSLALLAGAIAFGFELWLARRREAQEAQKRPWTAQDAVGRLAHITLTIPGAGIGQGAVALRLAAGEEAEPVTFHAVTQGQGLTQGSYAHVLRAISKDTVEVQPAPMSAAPPPLPSQ